MKRLLLLVFVFYFLVSSPASAQQTYTYATRDTLPLKLDLYQPATPRGDGACVLYVFGGGFAVGARNDSASTVACRLLADKGFTVVSIDYRLYMRHAPKVPLLKAYTLFDTAINQAVEDCSDAIAFVCDHAREWNIDPTRIILTGSSAGAITVLQTDWCRANSLPLVASLPKDFRPAAVIPYAGGVNCRNGQLHYATPPAPTCFFHGTVDRIVAYKRFRGSVHGALYGAATVVKEFKKKGYSHWILRYEDRGHEVAGALPSTVDEFCAFVDATLCGHHMAYDATCVNSEIRQSRWTHMSLFQLYGLITKD